MSSTSYRFGQLAEEAAVNYLSGLDGWRVLQRNFRGRSGEVDLVARCGPCFVFVEVKSSQTRPPVEALGARQQQRIRRAAQEYLQRHGPAHEVEMRFDVLWLWGQPFEIEHLIDAF